MPMLDPYLRWAELTGFRDVARDSQGRVGVIIECSGTVAELQQQISKGRLPGVQLPALYREGGVVAAEDLHYCTAWVERDHLQALAGQVKRFKLGMAMDGYEPPSAPRPSRHCSARVVIGIIDDFVAFAHPAFAAANGDSRVRFVWSQDAKAPASRAAGFWQAAQHLGYGHELVVASAEAYPAVLPRATHGTHVADLAAGHWPDAAEQAPDIVAVHLPRRGVDDTSGSALKMQALDALHYIIERAGPQAGVVVNLSYGTMAGAHDGKSILELAIDELIDLLEGRLHVVLPAGNSYDARCHAVLDLAPDHPRQTLQWNVLPDDATPSFVELWLPDPHVAAQIKVKVSDPSGRSSDWCSVDEEFPPRGMPPSQVDFALIFQGSVADSLQGTMILAALAATAAGSPGAARANAGLWCIELSYAGEDPPVEVHAWIERDDTLPGRPQRGRQSYFVDTGGKQVRADGSFNSIANGLRTVVVGGYVGSTGDVASYSGGGPTRGLRSGPTLLAPSEQSPTQHGLLAAATSGVDKVRINGTSVAAPQVTRRIASSLSRCSGNGPPRLTPEQCLDCLLARARGPAPGEPSLPREGRGRLVPEDDPAGGRLTSAPGAAAAMPTRRHAE